MLFSVGVCVCVGGGTLYSVQRLSELPYRGSGGRNGPAITDNSPRIRVTGAQTHTHAHTHTLTHRLHKAPETLAVGALGAPLDGK